MPSAEAIGAQKAERCAVARGAGAQEGALHHRVECPVAACDPRTPCATGPGQASAFNTPRLT